MVSAERVDVGEGEQMLLPAPELLAFIAVNGGLTEKTPSRFMTTPAGRRTRHRNWAILVRLTRNPAPTYRDLAHAFTANRSRKRIQQIVAAGEHWLRRELGMGHAGELLNQPESIQLPEGQRLLVSADSLEGLDVPRRVIQALTRAGLTTIADLENCPDVAKHVSGIGKQTAERIKDALAARKLVP